jgi:signal transduction histidine kinase
LHRSTPKGGRSSANILGVTLEGAVLAVVAVDDDACLRIGAGLRAAGATVRSGILNASALAMFSAPRFDAAVLDIGDDPEPFVALLAAIRSDPRTQAMPLFALPSPGLHCGRLAGLGPVHVVPDGRLSELAQVVSDVVGGRRVALEASDRARGLEERLRSALVRLSALRSEAQTFTHDARVLFGVVSGFAGNLRDGIAGPLDTTQRAHVSQILKAAGDAASMVDRFGGAARAHTELPGETGSVSAASPRTARRTLLDLVEVARSTTHLFETVAEQKSVAIEFEAPEPVSLWGDSMQMKQVVTNLLVNALKVTPSGGRVTVIVRSVAPKGPVSGPAARHHAELIVRDTGPGIPPDDRERVFERGVRLARDASTRGAGVGLAVVREISAMHGGTARADEAPGGGASMVVRLPLDMRSRREPFGVMLIDDANAARRVVDALRTRREWTREALERDEGGIIAALQACRAVIVVPHSRRAELAEILGRSSETPPASRPDGGGGG